LRLFQNKSLRYAVLTMTLFAMAFFGSGLLLPSYLQQVPAGNRPDGRSAHRPAGPGREC